MIYPQNLNAVDNFGDDYAFLLDTTTSTIATIQRAMNGSTPVPGEYLYVFANLAPGVHHLLYVEPYRGEEYLLSSKRATVTVPADNSAVTRDLSLLRQWRAHSVLPEELMPYPTSYAIELASLDYLNATDGWLAVSTNNGKPWPGTYADDIYRTQDGGKTWVKTAHVPAPVINYDGLEDTGPMTVPVHGLHFSDAQHGVLIAQVHNNWGVPFGYGTYVTSDGGQTWTTGTILPLDNYYGGYACEPAWDQSNRNNGVVYGPYTYPKSSTVLYTRVTTDGGQTWRDDQAFAGPDIGAKDFGYEKVLEFSGGNYCDASQIPGQSQGMLLLSGASAWQNLTATPDGARPRRSQHTTRAARRPERDRADDLGRMAKGTIIARMMAELAGRTTTGLIARKDRTTPISPGCAT